MGFFKTTLKRLEGPTPEYFTKIRTFAAWYTGAATAFLASVKVFDLPTPDNIFNIIGYSIAVATAMGFTSSLPIKDKPEDKQN